MTHTDLLDTGDAKEFRIQFLFLNFLQFSLIFIALFGGLSSSFCLEALLVIFDFPSRGRACGIMEVFMPMKRKEQFTAKGGVSPLLIRSHLVLPGRPEFSHPRQRQEQDALFLFSEPEYMASGSRCPDAHFIE